MRYTHTPFMGAVAELIRRIDATIPSRIKQTVDLVLVGGAAVHYYTGARMSNDVEGIFSYRVLLPTDLVATYLDDAGQRRSLHFDTNYMASIALLHPDYAGDAEPICRLGRFDVKALSPTDLAVTKIGRFLGNDADDIRALAAAGLVQADTVMTRCAQALEYYIGDVTRIGYNMRDAAELIGETLAATATPSSGPDGLDPDEMEP